MKFIFSLLLVLTIQVKASQYDYEYLPFLDENIKVGLGMSYSKLEANSEVGNYYLLSAANPRLEVSYSSPVVNFYRHKFFGSLIQELFRPENDTLSIKNKEARYSTFISWQPMWLSEGKTFVKHFRFAAKHGSFITETTNAFSTAGDIGDRYALDAGLGFTWYGLTVSKFPIGLEAEVLYSQTLFEHAANTVYNGLSYRMGIDFEFKKRSIFSGWGMRGFYQYDDIQNNYSHVVHKEVGIVFSKATAF